MSQGYGPKSGSYARAAGSYGQHGGQGDTAREVEAKILLRAARQIQDLHDSWDGQDTQRIEKTISYNRQVWAVFYDMALEAANDPSAKGKMSANILSLATFVFQRSLDILADPDREKLPVLITINREIAAGLMERAPAAEIPG
ncbi:MAG: flagellar biosynthesis regulator FlaF [Pseudomonadota bacterium]